MEVSNKMAARSDLSILELEMIFRQMLSRISLSFFQFWPECFTACFSFSSVEPTSSASIMVPTSLPTLESPMMMRLGDCLGERQTGTGTFLLHLLLNNFRNLLISSSSFTED